MEHRLLPLSAICLGILLAGCTIYQSTEIARPSEERLKVKFENETASRLFNSMLSDRMILRKNNVAHNVSLAGITFYRDEQKLSDNAFWNDEVRRCDTDGDLLITEQEARTYSRSDPFN